MIKKDEFLELIADAIDRYNKKNIENTLERPELIWDNLRPGDYVVFDKVISKYLTVGKKYIVNYISPNWANDSYYEYFHIQDDRGHKKSIKKHPNGYFVRIAPKEKVI